MATLPKITAVFTTTLARRMSATDTSFTLTGVEDKTGNNISGYYCFVIDEGTSKEEFVLGTLNATTKIVSDLTRGIDYSDPTTGVDALKQKHDRGAVVKITNYTALGLMRDIINGDEALPNKLTYENMETISDDKDLVSKKYVDDENDKNVKTTGDETIAGTKTFSSSPQVPTPTSDSDATTKAYADGLAIAGSPDASTTVKGIAKLKSAPTTPTAPVVLNEEEASSTLESSKLIRLGSSAGTPAKGSIIVYSGSKPILLDIGDNNQVLTADSSETGGVKWSNNIATTTTVPFGKTGDSNQAFGYAIYLQSNDTTELVLKPSSVFYRYNNTYQENANLDPTTINGKFPSSMEIGDYIYSRLNSTLVRVAKSSFTSTPTSIDITTNGLDASDSDCFCASNNVMYYIAYNDASKIYTVTITGTTASKSLTYTLSGTGATTNPSYVFKKGDYLYKLTLGANIYKYSISGATATYDSTISLSALDTTSISYKDTLVYNLNDTIYYFGIKNNSGDVDYPNRRDITLYNITNLL